MLPVKDNDDLLRVMRDAEPVAFGWLSDLG
jgi:hypothetical protein